MYNRADAALGVMGGSERDELVGPARNLSAVKERRGKGNIVAVDFHTSAAVRSHGPEALYVELALIDVLPACVKDSAVLEHGWRELADRAVGQLVHVASVCVDSV